MIDKKIVEKIIGELIIKYGELGKENFPKDMSKTDYIDYSISITSSFMATLWDVVNKQTGSQIDLEKTLNTMFNSIKFYLLERQ